MDLETREGPRRIRRGLAAFLTPYQYRCMVNKDYIPVTGSNGGRYRVWCTGLVSNIKVMSVVFKPVDLSALEPNCCPGCRAQYRAVSARGALEIRPGATICAVPTAYTTRMDAWIQQALLLQADEMAVLAVAVT